MSSRMRYTMGCVALAAAAGVFSMASRAESAALRSLPRVDSTRRPATRPADRRSMATSRPSTRPAATRPAQVTTRPSADKVIAYYFHRKLRCPTCLRIEELSKQAVKSAFSGELELGTVEWRPVNIEQKGNEHFEKDYKLQFQSLVLVRMVNGKQVGWQNMEKVWDLVANPSEFVNYVQEGVRGSLYGDGSGRPQ